MFSTMFKDPTLASDGINLAVELSTYSRFLVEGGSLAPVAKRLDLHRFFVNSPPDELRTLTTFIQWPRNPRLAHHVA